MWGYSLPFSVTAGLIFLTALLASKLLPKVEKKKSSNNLGGVEHDDKESNAMKILAIPKILVGVVALLVTSNSVGFLIATLEPHLRQVTKPKMDEQ